MRDTLRIARILSKVSLIWYKNPDLRFFQLVEYIKHLCKIEGDPFYFEDDKFEETLKN